MGTEIEITNVNKDAGFVSYNLNGETKTSEVILPAQIKYAKNGKADAGFNPEGKISFLKSLEPKQESGGNYGSYGNYPKKESNIMAISTMEILEDATLSEIKAVYDSLNVRGGDKKCGASSLYRRENGKYDAALYVTTFVKKDQPNPQM